MTLLFEFYDEMVILPDDWEKIKELLTEEFEELDFDELETTEELLDFLDENHIDYEIIER
ncbi:hypothetical protein EV215_0005 [Hypnocyclicus thermotrophus]|uniref:Uncharacterized protein n=1 Tax=Hypnocyclicus thermotrophus TaxID=1627895 RepID=A0AA46I6T5_9FUSO|nr:hypothetical protein [Hypnocyclicus thermotrophus]TDT72218.1 hypothetical protein EV215_0005 [Hypnocyclicus thermotrophus]